MRSRARAVLKSILESAGFEVQELEESVDLYATKDAECLVILCSDDAEEILEFDRRTYRLKGEEGEMECRKLLFTTRTDVAVRHAIRWGLDELAANAGRAVVAEVKGEVPSLELRSPAPAAARAAGRAGTGPAVRHVPPSIDEARALAVAGMEGTPVLRYIPFWEYSASCSGMREYRGKRIEFGCEKHGFINAVNGSMEEQDTGGVISSPLEEGAEVVPSKISREEAEARIRDSIMEEQTKKLRFRESKGDAIFYEEKIFRPAPEDVKVDLQILHLPVWTIRGKKIVEVNGVTGEILSEPMDEGVEVY